MSFHSFNQFNESLEFFIKNAIENVKNEQAQSNSGRIFQYLKHNYADHAFVQTLTEKDLINYLSLNAQNSGSNVKFKKEPDDQQAKNSNRNELELSLNYTISKQKKFPSLNLNLVKTQAQSNNQLLHPPKFVNAKEITLVLISNLLNFKPPFTPIQIIAIESLKKPNIKSILCSFCLGSEKANLLGRFDRFLTCCDCGSSCHPDCLKYSASLTRNLLEKKIKWVCLECKKCSVCFETCNSLLLCDKCDRGFHKKCCRPVLRNRPEGDFICHVCKELSL